MHSQLNPRLGQEAETPRTVLKFARHMAAHIWWSSLRCLPPCMHAQIRAYQLIRRRIDIRMYAHGRWVMQDIPRWHATRGSSPQCLLPCTRTCACTFRGMHRVPAYLLPVCVCVCVCLQSVYTCARTHALRDIITRARAHTHTQHYRASWMKFAMPTCRAM